MPRPSPSTHCKHEHLSFSSSSHILSSGYKRPTLEQRLAAATPSGVLKPAACSSAAAKIDTLYPAPLILPGDDLALNHSEPPQSLRSWLREKARNKVTPERNIIYVAAPPGYDDGVEHVRDWTRPTGQSKMGEIDYESVRAYLEVFYHELEVVLLPSGVFSFTPDATSTTKSSKTKPRSKATTSKSSPNSTLGLRTQHSTTYTVIRTRPTPAYPYPHQLNLNDLLDFAIDSLPSNAYALLILVEHDLYEDEEDEFVCGRAYGGSRVSVVSGARYWTGLDGEEGVERSHGWPGSHCRDYLDTFLDEYQGKGKGKGRRRNDAVEKADVKKSASTPLHLALSAHLSTPPTLSPQSLHTLHLTRICRTAAHELGHCFGIAHCVYYACIMQGSASVAEDARQPPYLCPVCEAKVVRAMSGGSSGASGGRSAKSGEVEEKRIEGRRIERLRALSGFCERVVGELGEEGRGSMFGALGEWVGGVLGEEKGEGMDLETDVEMKG